MHVLVIPSEAYVPPHNKLEGIFQHHQAAALKRAGYKVGALSIELSYSLPMMVKGLLFRLLGRRAGNATDTQSIGEMLRTGLGKTFTPKKFISREVMDGVNLYRIDARYRRPPVTHHNHMSWIKAGLVCFEAYVHNHGKPDIVHAHEGIYAGMLAQKIEEKYNIPYIVTEHSTFYATGRPDAGLLQRVKKAYEKAAALFAVSDDFAGLLNKLFATDRFRYLPNVLDLQFETEAKRAGTRQNGRFRFLNIALLKPVKDQLTLLKAFGRVMKENPNVELAIVGFGVMEAQLKKAVEESGLEEHVQFLGELGREDVVAELRNCDCFVLSSQYETFGVVLIEAMLFGKPVVSTAVGVAPAILNAQTGFSVNVGDEEALACAMMRAIDRRDKFDPEFIRNFTVANFGNEAFVKRLTKIYREVRLHEN